VDTIEVASISFNANAILDKVLSIDTRVWAASIIESNGNILAAKSKPLFKETFGVIQDGESTVEVWRLQR
jgi:hypothetical protein